MAATTYPEKDLSRSQMTGMTQLSLDHLSAHLAANYVNVSLARVNPKRAKPHPGHKERVEEQKLMFKRVFEKGFRPSNEFSRNILIVGANVSKQAFRFFNDGTGTIKEVEAELGLEERMRNPHFQEQYALHANTILRSSFDISSQQEVLMTKLGMEGRLAVLEKLYSPKTVRKALNELVYHRHFPNLGYELIAHMFKHRFIDVVVNLNFDELLDNAIHDEMGESALQIITPENVLDKADRLFTHHRLRNPIYIKPHGTAGQFSSLTYTEAQYLDMNPTMREVLSNVFSGDTGSDSRTSVVNIMALGYAYNDLDLRRILFDSIVSNDKGIYNLFMWSRTPLDRFNRLGVAFERYCVDLSWSKAGRLTEAREDSAKARAATIWPKRLLIGKGEKVPSAKPIVQGRSGNGRVRLHPLYFNERAKNNQYDADLAKLCGQVDDMLAEPFGVGRPRRHELLTRVFTKDYVEHVQSKVQEARDSAISIRSRLLALKEGRPLPKARKGTRRLSLPKLVKALEDAEALPKELLREFYARRAQFHIIYDFFKHSGRIPYSVFQGERAATYYELYLQEFDGLERYQAMSLKDLANDVIDGFDYYPAHCGHEVLLKPKRRAIAQKSIGKFLRLINKGRSGASRSDAKIRFVAAMCNMRDHRHFEITPKIHDPKYGRFKAYDAAQVIFTNLHLTYQFYSMFKDHKDKLPKWDTLLFSSDTARALYNLYYYAGGDLLKRARNKRVYLLCEDCLTPKRKGKPAKAKMMTEALKKHLRKDLVFFQDAKSLFEHRHHMALFFKDKIPVTGIYVFKPSTRNRINPVYFDRIELFMTEAEAEVRRERPSDQSKKLIAAVKDNNIGNLETMAALFKEEFEAAGGRLGVDLGAWATK